MANSGSGTGIGAGRTLHRLHGRKLTARRAGQAIALYTVGISVAGGLLMRIVDPEEFPNIWLGLWWAVQTVTTVGYGDVTPTAISGRVIGAVIMVSGIGFLTVVTAVVTALFLESVREEFGHGSGAAGEQLESIDERLQRIEAALSELQTRAAGPDRP